MTRTAEKTGGMREMRGSASLSSGAESSLLAGKSKVPILLLVIGAWYGLWMWLPLALVGHSSILNLTFNSMLTHLMHGQFDVDPQIIGAEGYLRGGHVYAYWGIWCALLRLPLWIVGRMDIDISVWSCLTALLIAAGAKLRLLFRLRQFGSPNRVTRSACNLMLVYILLGGSDAGHLRACVFEEVILWGYAFATVFVYFAVKGLIEGNFSTGRLSAMALCAGLAIATRVTAGIGLTLALGLLLMVLIAQSDTGAPDRQSALQARVNAIWSRRVWLPLGILAACIVATGYVNYMRWGNPLTFVDYRFYIGNRLWPDRIAREAVYGNFNLHRIPLGVLYYFVPVWALHTGTGHLLFGAAQVRWFDIVELPPSSFLMTDLLPLCLICFLPIAFLRRRPRLSSVAQPASIAAGLLAPCVLMLCFVALTYRYRLEFCPEIDFLSFLGLYLIFTDDTVQAKFSGVRKWMMAATVVSVGGTFVALLLYLHSPFGPAQFTMQPGTAQTTVSGSPGR